MSGGQFDWGGRLPKSNGGVQRFFQTGRKSVVECKGQKSLIVRLTSRTRTKVGLSVPTILCGRVVAKRIKVTLGITGWSPPRVHIDGEVWHLDVGSSHPGAVNCPKGWAVRPWKRHASWVQNVVRQFGPYPVWAWDWEDLFLVREDQKRRTSGVPVIVLANGKRWVAMYGKDNCWKHLSRKLSSRWVPLSLRQKCKSETSRSIRCKYSNV